MICAMIARLCISRAKRTINELFLRESNMLDISIPRTAKKYMNILI